MWSEHAWDLRASDVFLSLVILLAVLEDPLTGAMPSNRKAERGEEKELKSDGVVFMCVYFYVSLCMWKGR